MRLQSYLRGNISGRAIRIGPFLATVDEDDPNPFLNHAIPDDAG